jgi:predicted aconitase
MEIIVGLGRVYGARDLVPVSSSQVAGVSYVNLGDAGLEFLVDWREAGAKASIPAMLNPAGMDLLAWKDLGVPDSFAIKQGMVVETYIAMGIRPSCSCTPYLVGNVPTMGDHLAWSESSAVSFANSVLGARTNREGGPSALASALVGKTADYGLHLDEHRQATAFVDVACALRSVADFGALGYMVGRQVKSGVPCFRLRDVPDVFSAWDNGELPTEPALSMLKQLGAAMAASGAVALYHVEGLTPEARVHEVLGPHAQRVRVDDLGEGYTGLNSSVERVDLVSVGCPHASIEEIRRVGVLLEGRTLTADLWVTTARGTREEAVRLGLLEPIEAAGGAVVADTCLVVSPMKMLGYRSLATNSAKMAFYARSHAGLEVRFGSAERCVEAAITGVWQ